MMCFSILAGCMVWWLLVVLVGCGVFFILKRGLWPLCARIVHCPWCWRACHVLAHYPEQWSSTICPYHARCLRTQQAARRLRKQREGVQQA
jgi:hypothetical protein